MDFSDYNLDTADIFQLLVKKEFYKNILINQILTQRMCIEDIRNNAQLAINSELPHIRLQLSKIFGRKAYNYLNNLAYDSNNQILYLAGANLLILVINQMQIDEIDHVQ